MARKLLTTGAYVDGIRNGNRVLLGQAITLVESTLPEHQECARAVVNALLENGHVPAHSLRIGITGSPGVGKSSFIEALGMRLIAQGRKVAVLAIDPSSQISKGSILGDKTRMEHLANSEMAFIRPSPAGSALGGVARKTRETIILVEAAGYDTVFIETVGVGQSETAVHGMTDLFILLLQPGAGDELQGIKRGIVEMADILVVNKADGERAPMARQAMLHYRNAVYLLPAKDSGWSPQVLSCSASEGTGIDALWDTILEFRQHIVDNGFLQENRKRQAAYWFRETLLEGLQTAFFQDPRVREQLRLLEPRVLAGLTSPFGAAETVLEAFFKPS